MNHGIDIKLISTTRIINHNPVDCDYVLYYEDWIDSKPGIAWRRIARNNYEDGSFGILNGDNPCILYVANSFHRAQKALRQYEWDLKHGSLRIRESVDDLMKNFEFTQFPIFLVVNNNGFPGYAVYEVSAGGYFYVSRSDLMQPGDYRTVPAKGIWNGEMRRITPLRFMQDETEADEFWRYCSSSIHIAKNLGKEMDR